MADLEAVVFDVDGTLVDSERFGHRVAFNAAFEAFDLPYRWDDDEYGRLLHTTGGERRIAGYLADQGVTADERDRLAPALHACKTKLLVEMIDGGALGARPGVVRLLDELVAGGVRLAVATTGSRAWVERLLSRVVPGIPFEVVVTGDEVTARKPDPEAFTEALARLDLPPAAAVAVEDSAEGVHSAVAAGLACAVVVNGYTAGHDLSSADLVLDGFGDVERPAAVLADRRATGCAGVLDCPTLARLVGREAG